MRKKAIFLVFSVFLTETVLPSPFEVKASELPSLLKTEQKALESPLKENDSTLTQLEEVGLGARKANMQVKTIKVVKAQKAKFEKNQKSLRKPKVSSAKTYRKRKAVKSYYQGKRVYWVTATAYSSTVDQCDSSPFITASGTRVHWGTIACNFLPFGTKVKIPDYFGDTIFTVEDRMGYSSRIDIWFSSRRQAINFGKRTVKMTVL